MAFAQVCRWDKKKKFRQVSTKLSPEQLLHCKKFQKWEEWYGMWVWVLKWGFLILVRWSVRVFFWFKPAMWLLEISLWLPVRLMHLLSRSSVLNVYDYIVISKCISNTIHQGFLVLKILLQIFLFGFWLFVIDYFILHLIPSFMISNVFHKKSTWNIQYLLVSPPKYLSLISYGCNWLCP